MYKTRKREDSMEALYKLSMEHNRLKTFGDDMPSNTRGQFAKAGFHFSINDQKMKCFACNLELDKNEIDFTVDTEDFHKKMNPDCYFAKNLKQGIGMRQKKFLSVLDSLHSENERLRTFIEWPLPFLLPEDLAADGFFYLRTYDKCACVFCKGIVTEWKDGDTPRNRHVKCFSTCPFINGKPVGNITRKHSAILDKLPLDGEENPITSSKRKYDPALSSSDSKGTGRGLHDARNDAQVIGLHLYSAPKWKDHFTTRKRLKSFNKWPERVVQTPKEMAEAGFISCGVSDHVICFHCGNGLRNWELSDIPWEEHARWYPECSFVNLQRGQGFIDQVQQDNKHQTLSPSSGRFKPLSNNDIDTLMDLDIIKGVEKLGFSQSIIRHVLIGKLAQTGTPFFDIKSCVDAILYLMDEECPNLEGSLSSIQLTEIVGQESENMSFLKKHIPSQTCQITVDGNTAHISSVDSHPLREQEKHNFCVTQDQTSDEDASESNLSGDVSQELECMKKKNKCMICKEAEKEVVFLPCSHMVACSNCTVTLAVCPVCSADIKHTVTPIIS